MTQLSAMLAASYDSMLVASALAVAMVAGFTGLNLSAGLAGLGIAARKAHLAMAAVALGGGIWSTHFLAMLALRLPVEIAFDALTTLGSALVAILLCGLGLMLLHAGRRSRGRIAAAGTVMGAGVVLMHYIGMAGLSGCRVTYGLAGYAVATLLAVPICTAALALTPKDRPRRELVPAAVAFGLAIVAMHFSAMHWTAFSPLPEAVPGAPSVDRGLLALIVAVAAFILCGALLLSTATVAAEQPPRGMPAPEPPEPPPAPVRIPYEKTGRILYVEAPEVAAIRAEGHYTILYGREDRMFCPWSISEAEERLPGDQFLRAHRSYLLNLAHVSGFERHRDSGLCRIEGFATLDSAPVSRGRIGAIRARLGMDA